MSFIDKIDTNKLKRDYINKPLKKIVHTYEIPYKEDILYMLNSITLPINDIATYFNVKPCTIYKWCKFFDIKIEKERSLKLRKQSCLEKYGCEYSLQNKKNKRKR